MVKARRAKSCRQKRIRISTGMYTTGKRHSLPTAQQDNKEMALLQNRRKSETSPQVQSVKRPINKSDVQTGGENEQINIQKDSYENSRKQICRIGSIKFNSVMNGTSSRCKKEFVCENGEDTHEDYTHCLRNIQTEVYI